VAAGSDVRAHTDVITDFLSVDTCTRPRTVGGWVSVGELTHSLTHSLIFRRDTIDTNR